MRSDFYQWVLIFLGVVVTALFSVFWYRELFPEYRIYQKDYVALEEFRSTYTGEPPPEFQAGVKQIVLPNPDKGPEKIDRCISCHVALQFPDFSPTKVAYDINGNLRLDERGWPLQVPNENYVFTRLEQRLAQGKDAKLEALNTPDVIKVLQAHPLIGRETRPFEYHPVDDFGCVSCHGGNGRGLTTEKAHGPVFDGDYEVEFMGVKPQFLEKDPLNDPLFSKVFNSKPGHELLFQTTPILVGELMQAKCAACHQTSTAAMLDTADSVQLLARRGNEKAEAITTGFTTEKEALLSNYRLLKQLSSDGVDKTEAWLKEQIKNYSLPQKQIKEYKSQLSFLQGGDVEVRLNRQIEESLGSPALVKQWAGQELDPFLKDHQGDKEATGTLFVKLARMNLDEGVKQHIKQTEQTFSNSGKDVSAMPSDIDNLMSGYQKGQELFLNQACYACHRISGFSRGGIGPELTNEGESYPWFVKESIVWPQADLKTSTMPNYHLDHEELEALVTYLLAQRNDTKKKIAIQEWEKGKKLPWEKAITPVEMKDLRYAMTVFATEGCAACHRLKGFESNVGLKGGSDQWFTGLFPEEVKGTDIVKTIDEHAKDIDERIVNNVRKEGLLDTLDPEIIESFYSNFKYALRAKNHEYTEKLKGAKDSVEKAKALYELENWKKRVKRVLLIYIQEYGLGRLVGPRPNWSGIYRSDEWLMEHFRNPGSLVARSIMPVFPFDDTKFYALTNMLDQLAKRNRDEVKEIWKQRGFDPQTAVKIFCSQCHGEYLEGHGPVAEWIYPIPKNLRDAQFLRNLTKERVIQSIVHGVHGTPMPPWGEVATDKTMSDGIPVITRDQATQIADWLFATLPGGQIIREDEGVPKWQYTPEKAVQELHDEGNDKKFLQSKEVFDVTPPPVPGDELHGYYIKKEYYTPENLWQGKQFFEMNCAVCHGNEGEGSGLRAEFLKEAKPRMLSNLNWIESRDDLRLLRSIKYGVPGTAMTPWGDLTSSMQRMQLVMYIRSLSEEPERRGKLFNALYQGFNKAELVIEEARVNEYKVLSGVKEQLEQTRREKIGSAEKAGEIYNAQVKLEGQLAKYRTLDQLLTDLKAEVKREREIYQSVGVALINKLPAVLPDLIQMINLNDNRYTLKEGVLQLNLTDAQIIRKQSQKIIDEIEKQKRSLEEERTRNEGRISPQLHELTSEIEAYQKLEQQTISGIEEALRSVQKQNEIYQTYASKRVNDKLQ